MKQIRSSGAGNPSPEILIDRWLDNHFASQLIGPAVSQHVIISNLKYPT